MNAEIITVGAEILAGDIVDSNGAEIAQALAGLGIAVSRRQSVPDDESLIGEAIREGISRAGTVLVTGGLGPTPDDRTREGVRAAFGLGSTLHPELEVELRARFAEFGYREMPPANLGQVTLPDGAVPMPNPIGTAPGFRLEREGGVVFVMPGIPREMRRMLADHVLPWLAEHRPGRAIAVRTLKTIGVGESDLVTRFRGVLESVAPVEVAFYPQLPGVNVKLTATAATSAEAVAVCDAAAARVGEALGLHVYTTTGESLAEVVGALLANRAWRVATAESCTGGRLAALLTSVPGSSGWVDRGFVTYSNRAKTEVLGVDPALIEAHGAVSEEVAAAMARGARERAGVDVAVAVTGIAGPGGGTDEKPVGLVYSAIAHAAGVVTHRSRQAGNREMIQTRSAQAELDRLRRLLLELPEQG